MENKKNADVAAIIKARKQSWMTLQVIEPSLYKKFPYLVQTGVNESKISIVIQRSCNETHMDAIRQYFPTIEFEFEYEEDTIEAGPVLLKDRDKEEKEQKSRCCLII
jgi:hypothetical protein